MIALRTFMIASMLTSQTDKPAEVPCRLTVQVAIACMGNEFSDAAENAADLFSSYGLDAGKIGQPSLGPYLQRFDCFRMYDSTGDLGIKALGAVEIAERDGLVKVWRIRIDKDKYKRYAWVADQYLKGRCPPANPVTN